MRLKRVRRLSCIVAISLVMVLMVSLLCSCSIASKKDLIRFAKKNFGACEFIREEHSGSGKDEYRTVYLRDKETGIEYMVTTKMNSLVIDGSVFGYSEHRYSDFQDLYIDYKSEEVSDEIEALENKYDMECELTDIRFRNRVSDSDAKKAAVELSEIISEHDTKHLCPVNHLIYAEDNVYVGCYNASTGEWYASGEYEVIDYVIENYDQNAQFQASLLCYINEFLQYDEIDKLFPDHDSMPQGKAYYFRDSNGKSFIAIRMEDFGGDAKGIRLFRDYASGMEEIDY